MWKKLMATLLALAALPALAPARQWRPAEEMTPEEEREARDLARQFVERLRENNDVAPLVEELFVRDFPSRLRREEEQIPMLFVTPEAAARAGDDDLKRFYVAEFNLFSRTLAYLMTRPETDEDEDSDSPENWYPPEVMRVLRDDPIISAVIALEKAQAAAEEERERAAGDDAAGAASRPPPEGHDERFVKDLATLRAATVTSGRAADMMRAYVPEFSALRRAQEKERVPGEAFEDVHVMFLDTREEEYLGFPPGTRSFSCARRSAENSGT
jgi:hypothetical protein